MLTILIHSTFEVFEIIIDTATLKMGRSEWSPQKGSHSVVFFGFTCPRSFLVSTGITTQDPYLHEKATGLLSLRLKLYLIMIRSIGMRSLTALFRVSSRYIASHRIRYH